MGATLIPVQKTKGKERNNLDTVKLGDPIGGADQLNHHSQSVRNRVGR